MPSKNLTTCLPASNGLLYEIQIQLYIGAMAQHVLHNRNIFKIQCARIPCQCHQASVAMTSYGRGYAITCTLQTMLPTFVMRSTDRAITRSSHRAIGQWSDRAIEPSGDLAIEPSSDQCIERSSDRAIKRLSHPAIEQSSDRALGGVKRTSDQAIERSIDRAIEPSSDRAIE